GGSDPFVGLAGADVDQAAKVAAQARNINGGQSCIAAKRFVVDASVHDRFLAQMTEHVRRLRMGDPLDPATDIGPQARRELRDELHVQVEQAIAQGAKVVLGCRVPDGPGAFYPPSILSEVGAEN